MGKSKLKFSELFWNTEFTSTHGFDLLVKRIKDGRTASKEFEAFVKERAKVEEDYAKSLSKLAKSACSTLEQGHMGDIFAAVKKQLDKASEAHAEMSRELLEQARRLHAIKESHSSACKPKEELVRKLQSQKKDLYSKVLSSKLNYQKKHSLFEQAKANFLDERCTEASRTTTRETDKLEQKYMKAKDEQLRSDDSYRNLVKQLEFVRMQWESEMEQACDVFQQTEEERLILFRNEFWVHVNYDSTTLFRQDEANEDVRDIMERCDVILDLQNFVESSQTGSVRPATIAYQSCGQKLSSHHMDPSPNSSSQGPTSDDGHYSKEMFDDPLYSTIEQT